MSLGTASEEIAKSEKLWKSSNFEALRAQQEVDFGHWGPHEFAMPVAEGKWDNVTTNTGKIMANKIMGLLSSSWLQLFIDVGEEAKKKRKSLANTERLANGVIWLADREAIQVPSGKKLQSALSSYAVLRGGTAKSVYWYEDEDGKPRCEIKSYDPMFCQWEEGEKEILWFCYRNPISKRFLERTYKNKKDFSYGSPDTQGQILTYAFWDDEKWKIAINGEYIDEGEHGLGYIPVNIRSCGAVPYLQSKEYQDTMKWSWQSYGVNIRDMLDLESKLMSIEASKALESGKIKITGEWDSQKSGNTPPQGLEKLGYGSRTRNEVILFDAALGQKFGGMVQPPNNETVDRFLTQIVDRIHAGSLDPITQGILSRAGSGALAAELRASALEFINPFRECVEEDFKWMAEESIRQFKGGQYEKIEVEGRDRKREKFSIGLEPKDVEEKHFECQLVFDRLRNELQELGAAIQKVSYGLSSRRTVMVKHNIVEDPDRELDIMDEEMAAQDPVFKYDKLAKYFKDQGDERMAQYYMALSAITIESTVKKAMMAELMPPPMPGEGEKKPSTISPQAEAANIATQPEKIIEVPEVAEERL